MRLHTLSDITASLTRGVVSAITFNIQDSTFFETSPVFRCALFWVSGLPVYFEFGSFVFAVEADCFDARVFPQAI
jgi:hypothetical protein